MQWSEQLEFDHLDRQKAVQDCFYVPYITPHEAQGVLELLILRLSEIVDGKEPSSVMGTKTHPN